MALSTLSEVTIKTGSGEAKEESPCPDEKLKKGHEAALECLSRLTGQLERLRTAEGSSHAATMLAAAAWLTGISLYRSLQQSRSSLSETDPRLDDLNHEWEKLVVLLEEYNLQRTDIPVGRVVLAAMGAPHLFKPQVEILNVQSALQEQYNAVMQKYGFNDLEGAQVGILLCSLLIQQYSHAGIIEAEAAMGVVAQRIFEATRGRIII